MSPEGVVRVRAGHDGPLARSPVRTPVCLRPYQPRSLVNHEDPHQPAPPRSFPARPRPGFRRERGAPARLQGLRGESLLGHAVEGLGRGLRVAPGLKSGIAGLRCRAATVEQRLLLATLCGSKPVARRGSLGRRASGNALGTPQLASRRPAGLGFGLIPLVHPWSGVEPAKTPDRFAERSCAAPGCP